MISLGLNPDLNSLISIICTSGLDDRECNLLAVYIPLLRDLECLTCYDVISKNLCSNAVFILINNIKESNPSLVDELIPKLLGLGEIQKVLQNLLKEGISIRDLLTIFETLADHAVVTRDTDVLEDMDGRIEAVIMGEICNVGIESTVVDMTGDVPTILRPGIITAELMRNVTGRDVVYDASLFEKHKGEDPGKGVSNSEFQPKSPGMKYRHYSPKAAVKIVEGDEETFKARTVELGIRAIEEGKKAAILNYGEDARKAAHKLFADLRELDRQGYDLILIRAIDEVGLGFSVMNRMLKSAGYDVVE